MQVSQAPIAKTAAQTQPAPGAAASGAASGATGSGILGTGGLAADILGALGGACPELGQTGAPTETAGGDFAALLPSDAPDAATTTAAAAKPGDAKLAWALFKTAATAQVGQTGAAAAIAPPASASPAPAAAAAAAAALAATIAGPQPAQAGGAVISGQTSTTAAKTADADKKDDKTSGEDTVGVDLLVLTAADALPTAMAGASVAQAAVLSGATPSAPNADAGEDRTFAPANQARPAAAVPNMQAQADDSVPAPQIAPPIGAQPVPAAAQGAGEIPDPAAAPPASAQQIVAAAVAAETAPRTAVVAAPAGRLQARTAAPSSSPAANPLDNGQIADAPATAPSGAADVASGRSQPATVAEAGAAANLDSQAQAPALAHPQGQSAAAIAKGAAPAQTAASTPGAAAPVSATQGQTASAQAASTQTAPAQATSGAPPSDPSVDASPAPSDPGLAAQPFVPDPAAAGAIAGAPAPLQTAATATQATPETVARLATQIVQTAQGPASQFNLTLHPAELGGVQVKIQVDKNGQVSASLSFDNPQAAADLSARADELRAQLGQAGFDVADGGLSFSLNGQGQQAAGDNAAQGGLMGGRAFRAAAAGAEDLLTQVTEAASRLGRSNAAAAGGLDIRI